MSSEKPYGTFDNGSAAEINETNLSERTAQPWRTGFIIVSVCSVLGIIARIIWFLRQNIGILICYLNLFEPPFAQDKSWSDFKNQSFAVGFDLTAGYGTAAVRFNNGTIFNVARVEGTSEYNDVLRRYSDLSAAHPTPPYYNCSSQITDIPRQWTRYMRKRVGLPASNDLIPLVEVLSKLKDQTNLFLGPEGPFEVAFITVPNLPALYNEDLLDAADYLNFQFLTLPTYIYRSGDQAQWPVSEINTAMAGNGLGIDDLFDDGVDAQPVEKSNVKTNNSSILEEPWTDNILSVLFTQTALAAHVGPFASARHFYNADGIVDFNLGLPSPPPPSSHPYWLGIGRALHIALFWNPHRGNRLGRVISYGESAHNEVFVKWLREEVLRAQESKEPENQPVFWSEEPVFAGARGAAIFARYCRRLPSYGTCFPDLRPRPPGW